MTLLIGYGNPGRGDDGLGPDFAERIAARGLPGVEVVVAYQLMVEHALMIAGARRVVFADAWLGGVPPFRFERLAPADGGDVTSHALSPDVALGLASTLFHAAPEAHVMAIAGTEFHRVHEGLSEGAAANLDQAEAYFLDWLAANPLPETAEPEARPATG